MNKIQVSHEVPIALLKESRNFNDYDYCLVHLTYDHPEYQQYYQESLALGRKVLLDNSLFELESMFDADKFAQKIIELNADKRENFEFIVPDALHDAAATISSFRNFENTYKDLPGKMIGVVQGKSLAEMLDCYKFMSEHADKIAIPFDSEAFEDYFEDTDIEATDKLKMWCTGRQHFLKQLVYKGLWNDNKPHHLLGCSLAREFSNNLYRSISIESIDTSNPVVAGLSNLKYNSNGLDTKPSVKLYTLINCKPTPEELALIEYNAKVFKEIIGR